MIPVIRHGEFYANQDVVSMRVAKFRQTPSVVAIAGFQAAGESEGEFFTLSNKFLRSFLQRA
ncbi:MAG: hypothetical protein HUJ31_15700 [Pseudomonadales bacterium]|nr:hypothetical protein [Pseudomonadales bacterium]